MKGRARGTLELLKKQSAFRGCLESTVFEGRHFETPGTWYLVPGTTSFLPFCCLLQAVVQPRVEVGNEQTRHIPRNTKMKDRQQQLHKACRVFQSFPLLSALRFISLAAIEFQDKKRVVTCFIPPSRSSLLLPRAYFSMIL